MLIFTVFSMMKGTKFAENDENLRFIRREEIMRFVSAMYPCNN